LAVMGYGSLNSNFLLLTSVFQLLTSVFQLLHCFQLSF